VDFVVFNLIEIGLETFDRSGLDGIIIDTQSGSQMSVYNST